MDALEYWGKVSLLKAGLVFSDALTTVSERYAREILTPEFGAGLEGVLQERSADLSGILNGVDYDEWSPDRDRYLPARYSVENPSPKEICRSVLLREVGLPRGDDVPLAGCVSRLVEQKGFDLIEARIGPILDRVRLVLLGSGDPRFEQRFRTLARTRPDRIAVTIGYDESLAHRIEGGADLFLMPSRYEPCGLNQIYSLRYGAVPVVRATGGLDDTVVDADADPGNGNGFKFEPYDPDALVATLDRAVTAWRDARRWSAIRRNGMRADFSWDRAARSYAALYARVKK
jgi:starch synthase